MGPNVEHILFFHDEVYISSNICMERRRGPEILLAPTSIRYRVPPNSFKCVDKPRDIIIASTFGNTMLDYLSLNITFFILHSIRITSCILVYDLYYRWLTGNGCVS